MTCLPGTRQRGTDALQNLPCGVRPKFEFLAQRLEVPFSNVDIQRSSLKGSGLPLSGIFLPGLLFLLVLMILAPSSQAEEQEWSYEIDNLHPDAARISADGNYSAILGYDFNGASDEYYLYLFDSNGSRLWDWKLSDPATFLDISGDGSRIVVGDEEEKIHVFGPESATPKGSYQTSCTGIRDLMLDHAGESITYICDQKVQSMAMNGSLLWTFDPGNTIADIARADESGHIFLSTYSNRFHYLGPSGQELWHYNASIGASRTAISADGKVAMGSDGEYLLTFDQNGSKIREMDLDTNVNHITVSGDGDYFAYTIFNKVTLYRWNGVQLWEYDSGFSGNFFELNYDGSFLVGGFDYGALVWNRTGTEPQWVVNEGGYSCGQASMDRHGRYLLLGFDERAMVYWNHDQEVHIDILAPGITTQGLPVDFSGHAVDGMPILGYEWSSGRDGILSDQATFTTANLSAGLHNIAFRVMDWDGLWSEPTLAELTIHAKPTAVLGQNLSSRVHEGLSTLFNGSGTTENSVANYNWSSDRDELLSNISSFDSKVLRPGQHIISLKVQDAHGVWSEPSTFPVYVNARPVAVYWGSNPAIAVRGEKIFFSGYGTDLEGDIVAYEWDLLGDGSVYFGGNGSTANFTYPEAKGYMIKMRVQDEEGHWSLPQEIRFQVTQRPTASIESVTPEKPVAGKRITLVAKGTDIDGTIRGYKWDLYGDGKLIFELDNATLDFIYPSAGNYTLRLWVHDNRGAWSEPVTQEIRILPAQGKGDDDGDGDDTLPMAFLGLAIIMFGISGFIMFKGSRPGGD